MIPEKQLKKIKQELDNCKRPIFFFDDDPDGLCSFLLLYKYKKEGKGVVVKASSKLTRMFANKVNEYGADKIFVLDLTDIASEFYDNVKVPIIWIDHHDIKEVLDPKIQYLNPRIKDPDEYSPTSYWCYKIVKKHAWIAAIGCIGDLITPDFLPAVQAEFPKLVNLKTKNPSKIKYKTKFGELVKIFAFILMGPTTKVMNCVKILSRIKDPFEILEGKTPRVKYIMKHFDKINKAYEEVKQDALKIKPKKGVYLFQYQHRVSVTKDLANELSYKYPKDMVIIGREKGDEIKLSLRYYKNIPKILEKAFIDVEGTGGGHAFACGAVIKLRDFGKFMEIIRQEVARH